VPFLIAGPGIPEGARRAELAALTDLFPTLCSLANLDIPDGLDGVDLLPLISGQTETAPRDHIISEYYGIGMLTQPYRTGNRGNSMRLIRTERLKYVNTFRHGELLFDLERDPREFRSVLDEPDYSDDLATLRVRLNTGFSWEAMIERIDADRERAKQYRSGLRPTTPNQYQLEDGRVFDAETSLYDARWLRTDTFGMSGIIPQMFH